MKTEIRNYGLIIAAILACLSCVLSCATTPSVPLDGKIVLGEPKPDKALVYVIREWRMIGGGVTMDVFCDDQLLGVLKSNRYTYSYVEPGRHIIWCHRNDTQVFDFIPGRTYYITVSLSETLDLVTEERGQALIEKVGRYEVADDKDRLKAAKTITKKWPKIREKIHGQESASISEEVVYTPPADTSGMLRIPAYTPVPVELTETISSRYNQSSDVIWLRAKDDVLIDGKLFVRKGAAVKAILRDVRSGASYGAEGKLDVAVLWVLAADGTVCPVTGQITSSAKGKTVGVLLGVLGGLLVKGDDVCHLIGTSSEIFTSEDIWISPLEPVLEPVQPGGTEPEYQNVILTKKGNWRFAPHKRVCPTLVEVGIQAEYNILGVKVIRVNGWELPSPVTAKKIKQSGDMWLAEFEGWSFLRTLCPGETPNQIIMQLSLPEGRSIMVKGDISFSLAP